ncbi:MAG TPA: flagellar filament capping protein FliD [Solirubrobacteraceae bacterium]|jgi:flagellar hook-associated protein 2
MAGLALSGLASGVDTSSIVEQLMAIERQPLARLKLNQSRLQTRDSGLKDIQSKLNAFKAAATALKDSSLWAFKQTVDSTDSKLVSGQLTSGAGVGTTTISVLGVASSTQKNYDYTPSAGLQTLTITPQWGASAFSVDVGANATVDDVAAAINGRADTPVFAAVVTPAAGGPPELVLSSRTTGAGSASNFTISSSAVGQFVASTSKAGTDTRYRLNGSTTTLTSPTNEIENAIPGVKLTVKGVTTTALSITVGAGTLDKDAVKAKLKSFVEAYNAVVVVTRGKLTDKSVPNATTTTDAIKGQLFGDTGLTSMLSAMRMGVSDAVAGNPAATDALADLGITTGAIGSGKSASSGSLSFDEAKFDALFASDPDAVRTLLGGVATRFEGLVNAQTGTNGALTLRLKSSDDEQRRITDAMTRSETRLAAKEKRLKAQFAAMEKALQASQTQQSWLSGQLASLGA